MAALRGLTSRTQPLKVLDTKFLFQKFWSELIFNQKREGLVTQASRRSQLRLKDLLEPMAGSFLTAPPSKALGLAFEPLEFGPACRVPGMR